MNYKLIKTKYFLTYAAIDFFSQEDLSTKASEYIAELKEKEKREFNTVIKKL